MLWQRAHQFRSDLALISGLTLLSSAATLSLPWLAGQLLGDVLEPAQEDLGQTIGLLVAALVILAVLTIASTILSAAASYRILAQLRRDIYDHVQLMPMDFHDRRSGGDLISLMTYEVGNLSSFLASTLANVPSMLLTAAGATVLLFLIDPTMAVVIPVLVPVFFIAMKLVGRRMRVLARRARKAEVAVIEAADNDLKMLPAIKAFAVEEDRSREYASKVDQARHLSLAQARISAFIAPTVGLIAALAVIAMLVVGAGSLASGERSPGELFAFLLYAALLTRPVGGLADLYGRFQIARGTLARLENVFAMHPEQGYFGGKQLVRAKGAIKFRDICFNYEGRPSLIEGLDFDIEPGEIVALTGDNGVGKSTLVKLLLRYYSPNSGQIMLDGSDIADLQIQSLRRQFGYVPQRPLLFNSTIAENIAFSDSNSGTEVDTNALERALKLAQADQFVAELPKGLKTEIGDYGVRLSGGQGQRVALARALYRDPPIYILDEATSMYDLDSEAAFVENCIEALRDRTVIIITHRPASLALADRVLDVRSDGIFEAGV
ncbi:ABC transporter ATP-binding protein [Erythrobacter sp. MTPC3]|uniref:ABC transporter ATP-binding protein n=1 Tax=Erythrobacter sp. MTPC3 TaxID=3056564 RepID=UPI0036F1B5DC